MIFGVADDRDPAAVFDDRLAFRDGIGGVIRAFSVKIGPDGRNDHFHIRFVEDRHEIDKAKAGNYLRAFGCGYERTTRAFELADLTVGVDRDNEEAAEILSPAEIPDVSGV